MATIPAYIHIGDECITGGQVGVKPATDFSVSLTGNLAGLALMMHEYQRVVPSGPDGVNGGNFLSYYDGTYIKSWQASGGTSSTISIATAKWKVNHLTGRTVNITAGTGAGQSKPIASNTATTITITGTWTTPPNATSVFNYGPGEVVQFHYIPNTLIPGANGDNWFEFASITPTGMLMQRLGSLYNNQSPGFRFLKSASPGGLNTWTTGQTGSVGVLNRWNDLRGIEEGLGNTLDVKAVVVDCLTTDIYTEPITFVTDVGAVIDNIRANISATALIVFVLPHQSVRNGAASAVAPFIRGFVRDTIAARKALGDLNLTTYDMSWGGFTWNFGESNAVPPANPRYYDLPTVVQSGIGLYNTIQAHYSATTITAPSGAPLPTVAIISDSQFAGVGKNPLMALYADQPSLVGGSPTGTVKSNVWIWDDAVQQLVNYDVMANGNTYGTTGWFGPDATLPTKLLKRYPQGVVIFKYAKGGVALTPEAVAAGASGYVESGGTIFDDLKTKWTRCRISCLQVTNRSADCIGMLVSMGENDVNAGEAATTAFETRSAQWVDDTRAVFNTRVDGDLPFVWMQGPPPATEVSGGSVLGLATLRNRYRTHLEKLEEGSGQTVSKNGLRLLHNDGTKYELSRDAIHYGGRTLWDIGDDAAALLIEIITSQDAGGSGAPSGGTDTGGTDTIGVDLLGTELVVETGAGLANADSYQSLADAEIRVASRGPTAEWTAATDEQKNDWLREAVGRGMDLLLEPLLAGYRTTDTQALAWPRQGAGDTRTGRALGVTVIPDAFKWIQVEWALLLSKGTDPLRTIDPVDDASRFATSTTDKMPGGFEESRGYAAPGVGGRPILPALTRVMLMASPFFMDTDSVSLA